MEIVVLRYGHRIVRDYRVTTHCCLVARAFGASKIEIIGENDPELLKSVGEIDQNWGTGIAVCFEDSWRKRIAHYKKLGYKIAHLTMYGIPVEEAQEEISKQEKVLVIIGSQKVETEVYESADYNVSVTRQPHSEIAALAVFLDRIQGGTGLNREFTGAKLKVEPMKTGKNVRRVEK